MVVVDINGIPVDFPFEPYEIQKNYMSKVIECLSNGTNGVLESPTGTGKTLSLLCSSLAWLQMAKTKLQAQQAVSVMGPGNNMLSELDTELDSAAADMVAGRSFLGLPTIIYASRTHSQLMQAMQELKRTSYRHMKASVLGSRDQLCIHPEVMGEQDRGQKIQLCKVKTTSRSCHFFNRVDKLKLDPNVANVSIIDIEDMVKLGQKHVFCPFFMTKELQQRADIVFMPYNYLLDPVARLSLGVQLRNNIVILDEAHNVEKTCEEAASIDIKTTDIVLAIEEVTAVMKMLTEDVMFIDESPKDFTADDLCILKQIFLDFEKTIDSISITSEGANFNGDYIFEILSKAGINNDNAPGITIVIDKIIQFLATVNEGPFARKGKGLQLFGDFLRIVFAKRNDDFKEKLQKCYKVHVVVENPNTNKKQSTWLSKAAAKATECRVLSYWCFSPGFGMNLIMDCGIKSIILTSGTLAPLKPLISELELDIPIRLENPHIVGNDQVCINIVPMGPDSEPLISTYQNRDNPKYIDSLGKSILNLSRIIPNGMLIFFPSYPVMKNCQDFWQCNGLWSSIESQKMIYVEPRDKNSFNTAMTEYYAKIADPNYKGAIFMGVCRGKVSEGLDFADANGRAVVITGLPFPPLKDAKVILKRQYMDRRNGTNKEYLNGQQWYSLEATRAVNQAVGRVIRHKNDFGAIILLDSRFKDTRIISQMSAWLRDDIKCVTNFGQIIGHLARFFKTAHNKYPPGQNKPPTNNDQKPEYETINSRSNFDFKSTSNCTSQLSNLSHSSSAMSSQNSSNYSQTTPGCSQSVPDPYSGDLLNPNGSVVINKRSIDVSALNPPKRKKIILIPNNRAEETKEVSLNATPAEYMAMVKKTLDKESLKEFIQALNTYRDHCDFKQFTNILTKIFSNRRGDSYLIRGLEPYIQLKHRDEFEAFWMRMR